VAPEICGVGKAMEQQHRIATGITVIIHDDF